MVIVLPSSETSVSSALHQAPGRAVDHGLERGVDVLRRAAAPLLAAGDQLQLDDALGAEADRDDAVEVLRRRGHEHADGLRAARPAPRARCTSWPMCGEPISSSPSATSTRLTGIFCSAPRIACSAARNAACGPFWLTAPRPTITLPRPGLSTSRASSGGERPFRRVELLHVVHEVQADGLRRAGVERGEHAGLAVGVDDRRPAGSRRRAPAAPCTRRLRASCGSRRRSTAARSSPAAA